MTNSPLRKIIAHFGDMNQIFKLMEELAELIRALAIAIARHGLNPDSILGDKEVQTEMVDVVLLLKQFGTIGWLQIAMNQEAEVKIDRTIERIESGYYKEAI